MRRKKGKRPIQKSTRANLYRNRKGILKTRRNPVFGFMMGFFRLVKLTLTVSFGITAIGVFSLVLILGYHQLTNAGYFEVKEIVLKGLNRTREPDVIRLAGLNKPVNIFALRLGEMGEELKRHPWIKDVSLKRQMPETIIVEVVEHRPVALLDIGEIYYLDETGKPFKKLGTEEENGLPVVTGFTRLDLIQGEMETVLDLLNILSERNDRVRVENIASIKYDRIRGITLRTREDNLLVEAGSKDYRVKFERLGRVLAHLKIEGLDRDLAYINLECGPRVIIR